MQVVAEAATGAVQRWIQLNDEATARIVKREEHIEWLRKLFAGWKEARPALRESRRRRDNAGKRRDGPTASGTNEGRDGGSSGRERRRWAASGVGETDDAPST